MYGKTSLISYLGYVTNKDKSDEQYIAAQFMIWEALGTKSQSKISVLIMIVEKQKFNV